LKKTLTLRHAALRAVGARLLGGDGARCERIVHVREWSNGHHHQTCPAPKLHHVDAERGHHACLLHRHSGGRDGVRHQLPQESKAALVLRPRFRLRHCWIRPGTRRDVCGRDPFAGRAARSRLRVVRFSCNRNSRLGDNLLQYRARSDHPHSSTSHQWVTERYQVMA